MAEIYVVWDVVIGLIVVGDARIGGGGWGWGVG
jgi:hypothetical protein